MAAGTGRSAPTGDIPARRARFRWSQFFLYVAGAATMLFGAGTLLWNHVIAPRSSGITGQIFSGLTDADRIEAEPGALNDFNVLIVTFDTTRADHLECYGNRSIRTPVLNRLAREGYLFGNCVTSVPATLPAHASLLTGLHPFTHGVRANGTFQLDDRNVTLPEILVEHGYATAGFISAYVLDSTYGLAQGFEHYDDDLTIGVKHSPQMFRERAAELTNKPLFEWLRNNGDEKFFCWVHYFDPHATYMPPEPFRTEYADDPYDGEIAYADSQLGKLLELLEELQVRDRTLVIMTADHGEGLGEHGEQTHSLLIYDSTLHVPLIINAPAVLPRGNVVRRQVGIIDVMPTVLDLLGIEPSRELEGISLLGAPSDGPRTIYIETLATKTLHGWAPLLGVRRDDYKFILAPRPELYDLRKDPRELDDISAKAPDILAELYRALEQMVGGDPLVAAEVHGNLELTEEARRALAALGYVATVRPDQENRPSLDPKDGMVHWEQVQKGVHQRNRGDIAGAIETLQMCLEKVPNDVWARQILAGAYQVQGRYDDALEVLQIAAVLSPNDESVQLGRAANYASKGDLDEADRLIRKVLKSRPDHPPAYMQLAQLALARRDEDEWLRLINRALELDHGAYRPMIMHRFGDHYLHRGEIELAREHFEKAIELDALNGEARAGMAEISIREGKLQEAIGQLQEALRFNPAQPRALAILGGVLSMQGKQDAAIQTLNRVLEMSKAFGPAYANLGLAYRRKGELEKAEETYRLGIEVAGNYDALHQNLAQLLARLGRWDEATEEFKEAVRCNPYNATALANIGVGHLRNERHDQATRFFRRAIQVDPRYAFAHTQLAGALLQLDRTPQAMRLFQRSLQLDPDQPQAGKIRYVLDQYKAAGGRLPAAAPDFSDEAADLEESPPTPPTPPAPTAVDGDGES